MDKTNLFQFPTLHGIDLHQNNKIWNACIYQIGEKAYSEISYGRKDGKQQNAVVEYTSGKNAGKSNETTPYQQCRLETERKWKNQKEKKHYSEATAADIVTTDAATDATTDAPAETKTPIITPMLAKTWTFPTPTTHAKNSDIVFPCWVQPKLDGLRCLIYYRANEDKEKKEDKDTGSIICQSRTGGLFSGLDHICKDVQSLLQHHPSWVLDGELYTREVPFEILAGIIKRKTRNAEQQAQLRQVEYHIYDIYDPQHPSMTFSDRVHLLAMIQPSEVIRPVLTHVANKPSDVMQRFHEYINDGHEGIMLRNAAGPYVPNHRSHHLQKYKEFMEEEFTIVGFTSGVGKYQNCVTWICSYEGGVFQVVPRGTIEQKRQWFIEGDTYIRKQLTVIFQQKMESGCPRFPVGKAIRDNY